jgi:hypothetical protein
MMSGALITLRALLREHPNGEKLLNYGTPGQLISTIVGEVSRRQRAIVVRYAHLNTSNWNRDLGLLKMELMQVEADMTLGSRSKHLEILEVILRQYAGVYWICFLELLDGEKVVNTRVKVDENAVKVDQSASSCKTKKVDEKKIDEKQSRWVLVGTPQEAKPKDDRVGEENIEKGEGEVVSSDGFELIFPEENAIKSCEVDGWCLV